MESKGNVIYKYQHSMKRNKVWIFPVFFSVIVLFSGCLDRSKPTEVKVFFPNSTWNYFTPMDAKFEVSDANKSYEVAVSLGVMDGFELNDVPLEIVITSPHGQQNIINKTLLVKKDGNYVGKAYGDVWTINKLFIRINNFPKQEPILFISKTVHSITSFLK